jgi:hypothetical protein
MTFWDEFFTRVPVSTAVMVTATVFTSPVTYAVYKLSEHAWHRWYNRRLRKQAAWYAAAHENRVEVALVLSVGESVAESARQHLKSLGKLGGGADIPVEEVFQKEGFGASEGQWFAYLEEVKRRVAKVRELGAMRVYVYTKMPVAMAVMVGATLMNGPEAVVHHFTNGSYIEVGRIRFETVRA